MNQIAPSECTATSFGALNRMFLYELAMTEIEPSCSVLVTSLVRCSQVTSLPSLSRTLPLALLEGIRYSLTCPVSSIQRNKRLFGMSLKSKYLPSPNHAGPSAQLHPVNILSKPVLPIKYFWKRSSMISIPGSG